MHLRNTTIQTFREADFTGLGAELRLRRTGHPKNLFVRGVRRPATITSEGHGGHIPETVVKPQRVADEEEPAPLQTLCAAG